MEHKGGYDEFVAISPMRWRRCPRKSAAYRLQRRATTRGGWTLFRRTSPTSRCTAVCIGMWIWFMCWWLSIRNVVISVTVPTQPALRRL